MRTLRQFASRVPLTALLLPLMLFVSSCSRYNNNGSLSIAGVIYLILAIAAIISLLKQDWDITKKLIWGGHHLVLSHRRLHHLLPVLRP